MSVTFFYFFFLFAQSSFSSNTLFSSFPIDRDLWLIAMWNGKKCSVCPLRFVSTKNKKKRTYYANIILDLSHQPTSFVQKWIHWRVWQYNAIKKGYPKALKEIITLKASIVRIILLRVRGYERSYNLWRAGRALSGPPCPGTTDCHPFCERIRSEARDGEICSASRLLFVSPQNGDSLDDSTILP